MIRNNKEPHKPPFCTSFLVDEDDEPVALNVKFSIEYISKAFNRGGNVESLVDFSEIFELLEAVALVMKNSVTLAYEGVMGSSE